MVSRRPHFGLRNVCSLNGYGELAVTALMHVEDMIQSQSSYSFSRRPMRGPCPINERPMPHGPHTIPFKTITTARDTIKEFNKVPLEGSPEMNEGLRKAAKHNPHNNTNHHHTSPIPPTTRRSTSSLTLRLTPHLKSAKTLLKHRLTVHQEIFSNHIAMLEPLA